MISPYWESLKEISYNDVDSHSELVLSASFFDCLFGDMMMPRLGTDGSPNNAAPGGPLLKAEAPPRLWVLLSGGQGGHATPKIFDFGSKRDGVFDYCRC